jgi:DNA-directed RNA polymerase subunit RPC12/RpoP
MKKLISLAEHDNRLRELYRVKEEGVLNGIACPECGEELYDSNPTQELESFPPQMEIACVHCNYTGTRLC